MVLIKRQIDFKRTFITFFMDSSDNFLLTNRIPFYNIFINNIDSNTGIDLCSWFLSTQKNHTIFFINAHCFNLVQKVEDYKKALLESDILLNDGIGIKIAGKIQGISFKENMNGTDFIPKILSFASNIQVPIFLFGGLPGVCETSKTVIQSKYPGINIVGCRDGYFTERENSFIIDQINQSKAKILIVGMGVPKQELWLHKNKEKFQFINISVGGGAILDFLSGRINRAPSIIRKMGFEWIFRLLMEPRRLFKRYIIGNINFILYIMFYSVASRRGKQTLYERGENE